MNNLTVFLDFKEKTRFNILNQMEYEIITIKTKDGRSVEILGNNSKFLALDEDLYSKGYQRLLMVDNCYIYIQKESLNDKLDEYLSTINLEDMNSSYCDYLAALASNDKSNSYIFQYLEDITEPIIEFIFKGVKRLSGSNKTKNHIFLIEKIESKINKQFGFDFNIKGFANEGL